MISRRVLYVILSVSCMPLFWVGAMDQQRLVSTHDLGDVASLLTWQKSPPRIQLQIGAWFAVLPAAYLSLSFRRRQRPARWRCCE